MKFPGEGLYSAAFVCSVLREGPIVNAKSWGSSEISPCLRVRKPKLITPRLWFTWSDLVSASSRPIAVAEEWTTPHSDSFEIT